MKKLNELLMAFRMRSTFEFRYWFVERDWEEWDRRIRVDSDVGKIEFLVREARDDTASQTIGTHDEYEHPIRKA